MVSEGDECVVDNQLQCFVLVVLRKRRTEEKEKKDGENKK